MILEWMRDPIKFEAAAESEQTYAGDLLSSMALTLEEFYETLKVLTYFQLFLFICLFI